MPALVSSIVQECSWFLMNVRQAAGAAALLTGNSPTHKYLHSQTGPEAPRLILHSKQNPGTADRPGARTARQRRQTPPPPWRRAEPFRQPKREPAKGGFVGPMTTVVVAPEPNVDGGQAIRGGDPEGPVHGSVQGREHRNTWNRSECWVPGLKRF